MLNSILTKYPTKNEITAIPKLISAISKNLLVNEKF